MPHADREERTPLCECGCARESHVWKDWDGGQAVGACVRVDCDCPAWRPSPSPAGSAAPTTATAQGWTKKDQQQEPVLKGESMKLMATCGHEFNWPDTAVAPDSVKCAACGKTVAIYGVDLEPRDET